MWGKWGVEGCMMRCEGCVAREEGRMVRCEGCVARDEGCVVRNEGYVAREEGVRGWVHVEGRGIR